MGYPFLRQLSGLCAGAKFSLEDLYPAGSATVLQQPTTD